MGSARFSLERSQRDRLSNDGLPLRDGKSGGHGQVSDEVDYRAMISHHVACEYEPFARGMFAAGNFNRKNGIDESPIATLLLLLRGTPSLYAPPATLQMNSAICVEFIVQKWDRGTVLVYAAAGGAASGCYRVAAMGVGPNDKTR
jgi:hypothetical protein